VQHSLFSHNLLSAGEASIELGVSIDTIRRWEKKGLIRSVRTSKGDRRFESYEIERCKAKNQSNKGRTFEHLKASSKTNLSVIELFAGAGGLALGLENAGLNLNLAIENNKDACSTLKLNRPDWNVQCIDVREVNFRNYNADIVTGGFPCQAFSYAGHKLGFDDIRGTLFFEFARCIKETMPKIVLGENVRGLEKHDQGRTLQTMIDVLEQIGYDVSYKVLKAQYFDVPQKRERLVILATRKNLCLESFFPQENNYILTVRDALNNVPISPGISYPTKKQKIMEIIPPGGYWKDLPVDVQKEYMGKSFYQGGGKTGMARRLDWDEPCLTLTCSPAQKQTERCHPAENRPLTIREYARIQTFPDDWQFSGSIISQYKQIGNAVPVNLAFHLGQTIRNILCS
jgi:DNA (cytosine-5)-methyltransferase 1